MNFQAESKIVGNEYEDLVFSDLIARGYIAFQKNTVIQNTGCEVDYIAIDPMGNEIFVEAKGGKSGLKKRPGAKRTDNVKKAIANAALIKAEYPETYYVIYFSEAPKIGSSSDKMINTALKHKIIDEVRYKNN